MFVKIVIQLFQFSSLKKYFNPFSSRFKAYLKDLISFDLNCLIIGFKTNKVTLNDFKPILFS